MSKIYRLSDKTFNVVADNNTFWIDVPLFQPPKEDLITTLILHLAWSGITGGAAGSNGVISGRYYSKHPDGSLLENDVRLDNAASTAGVPPLTITLYTGIAPANSGLTVRLGNIDHDINTRMKILSQYLKLKIANASTAYTGGIVKAILEGYAI